MNPILFLTHFRDTGLKKALEPAAVQELLGFAEATLEQIYFALDNKEGLLMHDKSVVLLFTDEDDYYE